MTEELHHSAPIGEPALVPAWYWDAFALRFMGLTYPQIAEKTQKSLSSVRHIFAKSGAMYKYWRDYVEVRKSESVEEGVDMLYGHLPNAMRKLITHAVEGRGLVSLEAIRTQMQYTIGKPEDRIKLDATVGIFNFTDWALSEQEKIKKEKQSDEEARKPVENLSKGAT